MLSLVAATKNRPQELERLLASLAHQSSCDFELIVVDQSDPDVQAGNCSVIKNFESAFAVLHISTSTRGLSKARNIGLAACSGEIIGFPDDDCWYAENVVARVVRYFAENERLALLSGCYTEPGVVNGNFPSLKSTINCWNVFSRLSSVTVFVRNSSASITRIGFDEKLGAGTEMPIGEEMDFSLKVLKRKVLAIYDPSLVIFHPLRRSVAQPLDRILAVERAHGYLLAKNSDVGVVALRMILGLVKLLVKIRSRHWRQRLGARLSGLRAGSSVSRVDG